jgi:hypothetical protein
VYISALDDASRMMNIEAFGMMNLVTAMSDVYCTFFPH